MKSSLLTLTFGLILSAILVGLASHSNAAPKISESRKIIFLAPSYKELIIQVPELNEKNLAAVRGNVEASGGMVFVGYCKKLNVLMYDMDTNVHTDYQFLNTAFMNVSMGYLIKDGSSISQVEISCGMNPETQPAQTQQ
jgi:hypothetical protein